MHFSNKCRKLIYGIKYTSLHDDGGGGGEMMMVMSKMIIRDGVYSPVPKY